MAIRIVREKGDPVLLEKAKPIKRFDEALVRLVEDMFETMQHYNGVGLAAPQIGISKQLIVVSTGEDGHSMALINPEITEVLGTCIDIEGCLSVPGVYGEVERSEKLTVRFQDVEGQEQQISADCLLARALQHEIDHLKGVLFLERVTRFVPQEELENDDDE